MCINDNMMNVRSRHFPHSDLQNQASCPEPPAASEAGDGVQKNVAALTNVTSKRPSGGTSVLCSIIDSSLCTSLPYLLVYLITV